MRDDLADQINRWALIECVNDGQRNFGLPMSVEPIFIDVNGDAVMWGISVSIKRSGETVHTLAFRFDQESIDEATYIDYDDEVSRCPGLD